MVVAIETGDLLCSPDREHLRATTEDFLHTIPANLVE
jgi:hypothetical protein